MLIEEISNNVLREILKSGEVEIKQIFKHRYTGGQCDWGYRTTGNDFFAWLVAQLKSK